MCRIRNYYVGVHTSVGFYSLYEEAIKELDRIYILQGGPGTGKSTFMRKVGLTLLEKGHDIDYLHCSSDNYTIDGVIAPSLKIALVDGTSPHVIVPKYPGVVEKIIYLGEFWNEGKLRSHKNQIRKLTDNRLENLAMAYKQFATAKNIHDEWEAIYLTAMDFEKAENVTEELLGEIFANPIEKEKEPSIRKLFFGAATPEGPVNFIDNLTEGMKKRYIIKGRPGSGKSTMMKKIKNYALDAGLSVEVFPCALDPGGLDMVIIPSLQVAIFDGTSPHQIDPTREEDHVIDMFHLCMNPAVETKRRSELEEIRDQYKQHMKLGIDFLKEAKRLNDLLKGYYTPTMNFSGVNQLREGVTRELLEYVDHMR